MSSGMILLPASMWGNMVRSPSGVTRFRTQSVAAPETAINGEQSMPAPVSARRTNIPLLSSATALMSQTRAAMEQNPDSLMWKLVDGDINKVDGRIPFEAAKQGDAAGQAVVDKYVEYLACGLVNVINIFQPDIICVGGGVCRQGENLLGPVRKIIEDERYSKYSEKQTQLCVAELGNDAGIVGAACLGENA